MRSLRVGLLVILTGGSLFGASCGDIAVRSVKTGIYSYISGSFTNSVATTQVNDFLTNIFTGITGGTPTTDPTTGATTGGA